MTKLPDIGDLCGNISEFGVGEDHLSHKQSDLAIQYTRRRLFCFHILLFNGFIIFYSKTYKINMHCYCIYLLKSQCGNT